MSSAPILKLEQKVGNYFNAAESNQSGGPTALLKDSHISCVREFPMHLVVRCLLYGFVYYSGFVTVIEN